jgi:shikimate kinase
VSSPTRSIVLIGMMGAGKSSVGRLLEKRTGLGRIDIDELIVQRARMPIAKIFASGGEEAFRDLETAALNEVRPDSPAIVVCGGGIVLRHGNVARLKQIGTVVWLEAPVDVLLERASRRRSRPLLQTENPRATILELLIARQPLYENAADVRVDTNGRSHDQVADVILRETQSVVAENRS